MCVCVWWVVGREGLDQIEVSHGAAHCSLHIMENQMAALRNSKSGASDLRGRFEWKDSKVEMDLKRKPQITTTAKKEL